MSIVIIFFLGILLLCIIIAQIYLIKNIVKTIKNTSNALKMTLVNNLLCEDTKCQTDTVELINSNLKAPKVFKTDWDYDINLYCANLVCRVQYGIEHGKPLIPTDQTLLTYLKTENQKAPVLGMVTVNKDSNIAWISFRGTITSDEWGTDINYIQEILPQTKKPAKMVKLSFLNDNKTSNTPMVHQGFVDLYMTFRQQLLSTIDKYNTTHPKKQLTQIYVCGHSLGAALATIVGLDLSNYYYDFNKLKIVVYNFASPRVGDEEFCKLVSKHTKLYRLVNTCDIVPTAPSSVSPNYTGDNIPYLFTHCGIERSFTLNWKSILTNHLMGVYIVGLKKFSR